MSLSDFQQALDSIVVPTFFGQPNEHGWYVDGIDPSTDESKRYLADRYEPEPTVTTEDFYVALKRGQEATS